MGNRQIIHNKILEVYAIYPKKMGKSAGVTKALLQCKTLNDATLLQKAVARYILHLMSEGTEKQYIMYFSTFMNQWKDWLDPDTGSVATPQADLKGLGFK